MTDTDWADAEASRVWVDAASAVTTTGRNEAIASALRAAHRKGKVEGLREAATVAQGVSKVTLTDYERMTGVAELPDGPTQDAIADAIAARASELEAE